MLNQDPDAMGNSVAFSKYAYLRWYVKALSNISTSVRLVNFLFIHISEAA
jgi:hypothetical protein